MWLAALQLGLYSVYFGQKQGHTCSVRQHTSSQVLPGCAAAVTFPIPSWCSVTITLVFVPPEDKQGSLRMAWTNNSCKI